MGSRDDPTRYLPLTESTYYILLALVEPLHGYGVMQKVDQLSEGTVAVGPVMVILMFQDIDAFLGALWAVLLLVALFYIVVLTGLSRRVRQLKQFRRLSTP